MKLHRNAALTWRGRRELVRRVLVEGWTLTTAAAAAGISVRGARKGGDGTRGQDRFAQNPSPRARTGRGRGGVGGNTAPGAAGDHSRLASAEVLADEKAPPPMVFLRRAVAFYRRYGIEVERVL